MDRTKKINEEIFKRLIEDSADNLRDLEFQTKSPIERLFLLSFLERECLGFFHYFFCREERLPFEYPDPKSEIADESEATIDYYGCEMKLIPQFRITEFFTVDFLIYIPSRNVKLVIECDGHDFHEKTKEQAIHDKKRDRKLITNGFLILRFTGSEIYNNRNGVINEVFHLLLRLIQQ